MKVIESDRLRNVAVLGHGDTGKTSLVSGLLYSAGAVNRLGRVEDGTTVTDYDEDEIKRRITISSAVAHCEWKGHKINLLDTPGYRAFILDTKSALTAAETGLIVIDAGAGVEVQTDLVWDYCNEAGVARMFVINKMDRDTANFDRSLESLGKSFGRAVVPLQLPIGREKDFKGIVDLVRNKAYTFATDGSGKSTVGDIPDDLQSQVETLREQLIEMVAESDDQLMEQFFEEGTLSDDELISGLRTSIRNGSLYPVFCSAATSNFGSRQLLDAITELAPNPLEGHPFPALEGDEETAVTPSADGTTAAVVFKTLADPFAGRINLVKVVTGRLKSDTSLHHVGSRHDERMGTLQIFQGKAHEPTTEVCAGDICGILKLKATTTGDTLAGPGFTAQFKRVEYPEPSISFAVEPASRGDEDKIGIAMARIMEEDPSLDFSRDPQTQEFLLSGSGQLHVEVSVNKLKSKYGVEVVLHTPKVPFRETITGTADVQGRHKKQTGGHGQFGDCKIRVEPNERGAGYEFVDKIFGGSIPRTYIPAVDKGIQETAARGVLAGYPVVDFKVELYDGSYHDVDSSEMAFKIAGSLAFRAAMAKARAVLLEPIMDVEIYVPEESAGDIMGDLNGRRGRIQGMDVKGSAQVVRAKVPMAEMLSYLPVLTSMTGGRGSFHMEMSHYDIVPGNIAEKIIAASKQDES